MNRAKFRWTESISKDIEEIKNEQKPLIKRCKKCGSASTNMIEFNGEILCAYCYEKEFKRHNFFEEFANLYTINYKNKK